MNKPLSCGAQDQLEAAIIQRRRLSITCRDAAGEERDHVNVLPVDIGSHDGHECLTILTSDNAGGILKIQLNTADIIAFQARDLMDPTIRHP